MILLQILRMFLMRRSREARRLKENQIALRAAFLEKENKILKRVRTKKKHGGTGAGWSD
jgi:hypothetical protein